MTRRNSPALTMSKPPPRLARVRRTARLELAFMAKQMRWSSGRSAASNSGEVAGEGLLRIDVEGRAVPGGQVPEWDLFATEPAFAVKKGMHGISSGFQQIYVKYKSRQGSRPAG